MPRGYDYIQFGPGEAETAECSVCGNEVLALLDTALGETP